MGTNRENHPEGGGGGVEGGGDDEGGREWARGG